MSPGLKQLNIGAHDGSFVFPSISTKTWRWEKGHRSRRQERRAEPISTDLEVHPGAPRCRDSDRVKRLPLATFVSLWGCTGSWFSMFAGGTITCAVPFTDTSFSAHLPFKIAPPPPDTGPHYSYEGCNAWVTVQKYRLPDKNQRDPEHTKVMGRIIQLRVLWFWLDR